MDLQCNFNEIRSDLRNVRQIAMQRLLSVSIVDRTLPKKFCTSFSTYYIGTRNEINVILHLKEYRDIANMNFRFKEKSLPRNYVNSVVQALHDFPMNEVLCAEHIFTEWRPDLIDQLMEHLTPQNIRIHVVAKAYEGIANETEKWYGTKHKKEAIPVEIINRWNNANENSDLRLPVKNEFIATKFDIKSQEANVIQVLF